jgi:hypothetical protein
LKYTWGNVCVCVCVCACVCVCVCVCVRLCVGGGGVAWRGVRTNDAGWWGRGFGGGEGGECPAARPPHRTGCCRCEMHAHSARTHPTLNARSTHPHTHTPTHPHTHTHPHMHTRSRTHAHNQPTLTVSASSRANSISSRASTNFSWMASTCARGVPCGWGALRGCAWRASWAGWWVWGQGEGPPTNPASVR